VVATAPNGGRVRPAQGEDHRPGEAANRPPSAQLDKRAWGKAVMLLNVVLIAAVAIVGLEHIQRDDETPNRAVESVPIVASTLPDPDAEPVTLPDSDPTSAPAGSPSAPATQTPPPGSATQPPRVQARMRSNFAKGDSWPVGAGFREVGSMAWPLGVVDRLMTHGAAQGPSAVSWLEKWMKSDVRTLGARVLFAPNHSGAAAMTAWHTSILDLPGQETPRTAMRLVMAPGAWKLVAIDGHGASTLAGASYAQEGRAATFSLVRKEDTVWVTAPDGSVTEVTDSRVASLSGPWASWELRDSSADKRPAGFEEIWAG
jgi:hypothetical protein